MNWKELLITTVLPSLCGVFVVCLLIVQVGGCWEAVDVEKEKTKQMAIEKGGVIL
jgi:hypothetical protein